MEKPSVEPVSTRQQFGRLFKGGAHSIALRWGVLLTLGLLVYFVAWPQLFAWYHSWQAQRALANQDCARARPHLEKCLQVWRDSAQTHFKLARCCWREGDLDAAESNLRRAARLGWPKQAVAVEGLLVQAQHALDQDLEKGLAEVIDSAKKSNDFELQTVAMEALVVGYLRVGHLKEAEAAARVLVGLDEDSWRSHWLLGSVLEATALDLAREEYERSLALKPDQARVHKSLAKILVRAGRPQEALDHFKEAHRDSPPDIESNLAAARAHYLLGQWDQARAFLDLVLAQDDKQGVHLALRGLVEMQENGPAAARPWLAKAEALAPNHPDVLDALAALATREADQQKISYFQQRKREYEKGIVQVAELQKKLAPLYRQEKRNLPEVEELSFQLGSALFQLGEDKIAVKWMGSVLRLNPEHTEAHQALAAFYRRTGDAAQAEHHQRKAQQKKGGG